MKPRIVALAVSNRLLLCGGNVTQDVHPRVTILVKHFTVDVELKFSQLKGKNEEQVEDVS